MRRMRVAFGRYGSLAASRVARWRGSYAPDIGLEGLTTGAAEMGASM